MPTSDNNQMNNQTRNSNKKGPSALVQAFLGTTVCNNNQQHNNDATATTLSVDAKEWKPTPTPVAGLSAEEQQKTLIQEHYNIHYNDILKNNHIPFILYAFKGCPEYDLPFAAAANEKYNQADDVEKNRFKFRTVKYHKFPEPVTVYFGGQGLTPTRNIIWNLITCLGVTPLRVAVDKIKKNKHGFTASPMCMAELRCKEDADKVIASLHRRALLDETGFYLAQTKEQVQVLSRYCDMLAYYKKNLPRSNNTTENSGNTSPASSNSSQGSNVSSRKTEERLSPTFIHRPHALVTVTREGKEFDNERNPLCDCDTCQQYFYPQTAFGNPVASAYNHVNAVYSPYVLSWICYYASLYEYNLEPVLIPTHALVTRLLTTEEDEIYCGVSRDAINNCRAMACRYWSSSSTHHVTTTTVHRRRQMCASSSAPRDNKNDCSV